MPRDPFRGLLGPVHDDPPGAMRDGWSKTGDLVETGTQIATGLYTMQADFSVGRGGSGAQYYTMKFGVPVPAPSAQARAEIRWKAEGTDVRRLIDIGNGVSISGTAQAASVEVFDVTSPIKQDFTPNPFLGTKYRVDTLITPGVRPDILAPPRLTPLRDDWTGPGGGGAHLGTLVNGSGVIIPPTVGAAGGPDAFVMVPQNAGVISFYYRVYGYAVGTGLPSQIQDIDGFIEPFADKNGTQFSCGQLPIFSSQGAWIPVPPMVNFIVFHNLTHAVLDKQIRISDFAWGIEG